ncbi:hypothetical protein [Rhodanobacter lindaniclasticus]
MPNKKKPPAKVEPLSENPTPGELRAWRAEMSRRYDSVAKRAAWRIYEDHFHREGSPTLAYIKDGSWLRFIPPDEKQRRYARWLREGAKLSDYDSWTDANVAGVIKRYVTRNKLDQHRAYRVLDPDGSAYRWTDNPTMTGRILEHLRQIAYSLTDPMLHAELRALGDAS